MTLKGTTGTTNGRSEDGYKDLTVDAKKQRAREKKNEWQRANRKHKAEDTRTANKTAKRQSLPFDDVVGPADDIDTDMELVGPAAAVEPVVGPVAVVDPASLDKLDDEDTLRYGGDASDEDQVDEQLTQRCQPPIISQ